MQHNDCLDKRFCQSAKVSSEFNSVSAMNRSSTNQPIHIQGDLYLSIWDYQSSLKVNKYLNLLFQHSFILAVTRPTRVPKTLMKHLNTNSFAHSSIATRIFKVDVSDRFPVFRKSRLISSWLEQKRLFCHQVRFKQKKYRIVKIIKRVNWTNVANLFNVIPAYSWFPEIFTGLYDIYFPNEN